MKPSVILKVKKKGLVNNVCVTKHYLQSCSNHWVEAILGCTEQADNMNIWRHNSYKILVSKHRLTSDKMFHLFSQDIAIFTFGQETVRNLTNSKMHAPIFWSIYFHSNSERCCLSWQMACKNSQLLCCNLWRIVFDFQLAADDVSEFWFSLPGLRVELVPCRHFPNSWFAFH